MSEQKNKAGIKPKKSKKKKSRGKKKANKVERPYPRRTIDKALKIANAIKEKNGGNPWGPNEVANAINLGARGNEFFYLAQASREFGITEGSRDAALIKLTKLGHDLVYAPNQDEEEKLKKQAFLKVPLFNSVLEYYKSSDLPEMKYLANTLTAQFKLSPETHEEFSDLFAQNCKYLGIGSGFEGEGNYSASGGENDEQSVNPTSEHLVVTLAEAKDDSGPLCFVVMPFSEKDESYSKGFFDEVLKNLIVPAGKESGFRVETANRKGSDIIQATIINNLLNADLVLTDLTTHNPNVLFELGMRIAKDKPVVLIRSIGTSAIFDVDNMLRVFEYNPNLWTSTINDDREGLTEHIKAAWERRDSDATYMKILTSQPS